MALFVIARSDSGCERRKPRGKLETATSSAAGGLLAAGSAIQCNQLISLDRRVGQRASSLLTNRISRQPLYISAMAPGDGYSVVSVFPNPLVCIHGRERPPGVPQYTGPEKCGAAQAREGLRIAYEKYQRICKGIPPDHTYWEQQNPKAIFSFRNPFFRTVNLRCENFTRTFDIPLMMKGFGLLDVEHPFFNIAFNLNPDQIHDFRSAESFIDTAEKIETALRDSGKRDLKVTYLASGSHMTPLITALRLMDNGAIDKADFIYTERDEKAVERVRIYLNAMARGEEAAFSGPIQELIKDFEKDGYETTFYFKYGSRDISLTMAVKRSENRSRDDYLKDADLLVIHDIGDSCRDHNNVWVRHMSRLKQGMKGPAWALMERDNVESFVPRTGTCKMEGESYNCQEVKGSYGCGSYMQLPERGMLALWSLDDKGRLVRAKPYLLRERVKASFGYYDHDFMYHRDDKDPFYNVYEVHYYPRRGREAYLIEILGPHDNFP